MSSNPTARISSGMPTIDDWLALTIEEIMMDLDPDWLDWQPAGDPR